MKKEIIEKILSEHTDPQKIAEAAWNLCLSYTSTNNRWWFEQGKSVGRKTISALNHQIAELEKIKTPESILEYIEFLENK